MVCDVRCALCAHDSLALLWHVCPRAERGGLHLVLIATSCVAAVRSGVCVWGVVAGVAAHGAAVVAAVAAAAIMCVLSVSLLATRHGGRVPCVGGCGRQRFQRCFRGQCGVVRGTGPWWGRRGGLCGLCRR